MNVNEEPITATEPAHIDDELEIIDLDDVEGHGMREVAAGLGAAALLAGGGTAAAASLTGHQSTKPVPTISNPMGTVDHATDQAIAAARSTRDGALGTAGATAASADALAVGAVHGTAVTASHVAGGAQRTAGAVLDASGALARDELKAAGQAVDATGDAALRTTRGVAGGAVSATQDVVSGTSATATSTASSTVTDATRKAATVVHLTVNTLNALESSVVATVTTLNPEAGAGASGMGSTGWVTFSVAGENLASVQVHNGQATITVRTLSLVGKTMQAVYSGDTVHASSLRSITL